MVSAVFWRDVQPTVEAATLEELSEFIRLKWIVKCTREDTSTSVM